MLVSKLIKGYFSLSNNTSNARSKRMRNLIKRSSAKRIYVSKAEIKYTNDKAIINIYVFNREKQFFLRKMLLYKRRLHIYKLWKINKTLSSNKKIKEIINLSKLIQNRHLIKLKSKKLLQKWYIKANYLNNKAWFLRKSATYLKKSTTYLNLFMNNEINFYIFRTRNLTKGIGSKNTTIETESKFNSFYVWFCNKISMYIKKRHFENKQLITSYPSILNMKTVKKNLIKNNIFKKYLIYLLKYRKEFLKRKNLKKNIFYLRFLVNQAKFGKLLPKLKIVLQNYLNRNIEINILDLKYLQLNSDIFTESIRIKARKKKVSMDQVFRNSLSLIKIPKKPYEYPNKSMLDTYRGFNVQNLHNTYRLYDSFLPYTDNKEVLHTFLNNLHFLKFFNKKTTAKNANILNKIKYKWLTGVRLEAAGRLTKRFTASRSLYTFKYKGNIRATNFNALDPKKTIPVVLLRNHNKSNCQYTFIKSKKRIGAFGIKGWLSSN